jgi:hypothetical protein
MPDTTDKRGGLRQRQNADCARRRVAGAAARKCGVTGADGASVFCAIAQAALQFSMARYKESLIWMFRCLYVYEVKCKQHNNKVGSLSAP